MGFFRYFCTKILKSNSNMARKKKEKRSTQSSGFMEALGIKNIFSNEIIWIFLGFLTIAVAVYMIIAFISFLSTGAADQTMIESAREGELMNAEVVFANACGKLGAYISYYFIKCCFGLPSFLIPVFLILLGVHLIQAYRVNLLKWFLSLMIVMIWASVTFAKFLSPLFVDACYNPGGDHGVYICQWIENLVGAPGLTIILGLTALAFLTWISAETIYVLRRILNPTMFLNKVKFKITNNDPEEKMESYENQIQTEEDPEVFDDPATQVVEFTETGAKIHDNGYEEEPEASGQSGSSGSSGNPGIDIALEVEVAKGDEETADANTLVDDNYKDMEPYDPKRDLENYKYPTLDLLKRYDNDGKPYIDMAEQNANKNRIVEVLRTFGVEISSIKATVGPTITLYEITLAPGVRITKIRSLEDDIALSLSALGIRIIAPMPGKGTVGIEVPNAKPSIVSMESILNSKKFQESQMELPCAVGKTITNEVFMFDLAKAPHLLVAGATGQGKSVGLNAIVTSLLYKKHPAELKIVLVDPKKVEFSIYKTTSWRRCPTRMPTPSSPM